MESEMNDQDSSRRSSSRIRAPEVDIGSLRVQFSPEVVRGFARVEAAVHKSQHFSPEILENLQEYAQGQAVHMESALYGVALVVRETMKHIHETGNERAQEALDNLFAELIGVTDKGKPFTVVKAPTKSR
jgi:hypothetical protein